MMNANWPLNLKQVRCVAGKPEGATWMREAITPGKVYDIVSQSTDAQFQTFAVTIIDDQGTPWIYGPQSFVPIESDAS